MELSMSNIAVNRGFSKLLRRIRPELDPLFEEFAKVEVIDPPFKAILVGISDDDPPDLFEEVRNRDGYYQVFAGVEYEGSRENLLGEIYRVLFQTIRQCPLDPELKGIYHELLVRFQRTHEVTGE